MPRSSILTALRVWCISAVVVFLTLLPSLSHALIPVPRVKPQAPNASQFLSDKDAKRFRLALRHAKRGEWSNVRGDIRKLDDPVAKDVMRWIVAARDRNVAFKDITYVVQNLNNWPRMTSIQAKAEGIMFDQPLSARKTVDWFAGREPVAGEGRAALARAHYRLGNKDSGDLWLKSAWRDSKLNRTRQLCPARLSSNPKACC